MTVTDARRWWWLALLAGGGALIYLLAPVLTPFVIAALFAYLGNPLVGRLAGPRFPRTAAVVLVFLVIVLSVFLLVVVIVPLLESQLAVLVRRWPEYVEWIQGTLLPWIQDRFGVAAGQPLDLGVLRQLLMDQWQQAGGIAARVLTAVSQSGRVLIEWLINLLLIPVVTFYLLRDWDRLIERLAQLLPRTIEPVAARLARECDEVLATFLRGQLWVMIALGIVYSVGLWIVGLDLAILIGMGAGLVSFVPYLGLIAGLLAGGVAAVAQFHDAVHLIPVAIVFGVGQLLESLVLTPLLVGDRIGLHPVAVIFAVMAGGQLFGLVGVLLALPVAAVIAVLLRHARERYLRSELYDPGDGG